MARFCSQQNVSGQVLSLSISFWLGPLLGIPLSEIINCQVVVFLYPSGKLGFEHVLSPSTVLFKFCWGWVGVCGT